MPGFGVTLRFGITLSVSGVWLVGVNQFTIDKELPIPGFKIDDSIRTIQANKLANLKLRRDQSKATACLSAITEAAKGTSNLMPFVISAVENNCTLGEISNALRDVFGEHQ